jgi:adenylyltransferase/sulfurtransferase
MKTLEDEISVNDLKRKLDENEKITVLDVREPAEFRICNIGGTLIPLGVLPLRLNELDPASDIAVICHHGNRSRWAVDFLRQRGFSRAKNVTGGIEAWAKSIDPAMPRY